MEGLNAVRGMQGLLEREVGMGGPILRRAFATEEDQPNEPGPARPPPQGPGHSGSFLADLPRVSRHLDVSVVTGITGSTFTFIAGSG